MRVAIVGPGRLGRTLAALLPRAGVDAVLVGRGQELPACDVVWLTVPESALGAVAAGLPAEPVALHASGATDLAVFAGRPGSGSLHPLMTFPGPEVAIPDLAGVPAAIAGDPRALAAAVALGRALGLAVFEVPGDRRLYHAAAVLAGNGATALLALACDALEAAGVPRHRCADALIPLARASLANATPDPARALTGPVARGERAVLDGHLAALREAGLDDVAALHTAVSAACAAALRRDPS
jgi:predicted short-subunit dehydrogenase-like oxidoreductase (DUF2520 family)